MLLAGGFLVVVCMQMRERCTGVVVDSWPNSEGGELPVVLFTTSDGKALKFVGRPYIGRFGPRHGGDVPVRYNSSRLDLVAFADSFPTEYLGNPEYIEMVDYTRRYSTVRFGAVRIATFRGTWSVPVGLTAMGLVLLTTVASSIIA